MSGQKVGLNYTDYVGLLASRRFAGHLSQTYVSQMTGLEWIDRLCEEPDKSDLSAAMVECGIGMAFYWRQWIFTRVPL